MVQSREQRSIALWLELQEGKQRREAAGFFCFPYPCPRFIGSLRGGKPGQVKSDFSEPALEEHILLVFAPEVSELFHLLLVKILGVS